MWQAPRPALAPTGVQARMALETDFPHFVLFTLADSMARSAESTARIAQWRYCACGTRRCYSCSSACTRTHRAVLHDRRCLHVSARGHGYGTAACSVLELSSHPAAYRCSTGSTPMQARFMVNLASPPSARGAPLFWSVFKSKIEGIYYGSDYANISNVLREIVPASTSIFLTLTSPL